VVKFICYGKQIPGINRSTPRLIQSIVTGFNTVANNIWMVILPVVLDLFLWLGPQLRLQGLLGPFVKETTQFMMEVNSAEMAARLSTISEIWNNTLERFNMASFLHTFPIGVPILMTTKETLTTPFGEPLMIEINSFMSAFFLLGVFLLTGFILGCIYFNILARSTADQQISFNLKDFGYQALQAFALTIGLFMLLIFLSVPALFIVTIFSVISPGLANFVLLLMLFVILWLIIPLVFTPHIIFSGQRNLFVSALTSIRLVRSFLPGTGLFILVAILIAQGLDVLWRVPPANSWMTLIGIIGHAFIYTSLLAASFVYFRGGLRWMIQSLQQSDQRAAQA
jgi:hypothetical protein